MKLALLGDIAFMDEALLAGEWRNRLSKAAAFLKEYDYVVANLETPMTMASRSFVPKSMHLRSDERCIEILKALHINAVSLGNNHIYDFGGKGLNDTIRALERAGIDYFGVNGRVGHIQLESNRLAFHGFCCYSANGAGYARPRENGVHPLTAKNLINALKDDHRQGFYSVLSLHWGLEYTDLPGSDQIRLVHKILECYDAIVHGHHAHVMQGMESIGGSLAAYSLGNFYFDECVSPFVKGFRIKQTEQNKQSYILECDIERNELHSYRTHGIRNDDEYGIVFENNEEYVEAISKEISNYEEPYYQKKRIEQITHARRLVYAKHDFKWLMSKLNYHSILSRILTYPNKWRSVKALYL